MRYPLFLVFVLMAFSANSQIVVTKYDSTLKIGKAGYRISCFNKTVDRNILNIRPVGFKQEAREVCF